MTNKGYDQIRFLLPDNVDRAAGWKYGLTNSSHVTRFTKAWRASGKDYTEYREGIEKHYDNA